MLDVVDQSNSAEALDALRECLDCDRISRLRDRNGADGLFAEMMKVERGVEHLRRPGLHPIIAATLQRMLDEERGHLKWVKLWLDKQAVSRPTEVREVMRRYAAADAQIYAAISAEYGWRLAA